MIPLVAGSSNKVLAKKIAHLCCFLYIDAATSKFADGESRVSIPLMFKRGNKDKLFILQSISHPVNDNLMELLLLCDAAKRIGFTEITAIIPYLGYSRQEMVDNEGSPISASLVASLIEAAGINQVVTIDLHSDRVKEFFKIPVYNLNSADLFIPAIKKYMQIYRQNPKSCHPELDSGSNTQVQKEILKQVQDDGCNSSFTRSKHSAVVVAPDSGSIRRAQTISSILGINSVFINKVRNYNNQSVDATLKGDVTGKNCIVVDDIVDTGKTLISAAETLKENGALSINAFITHGVLSKNASELLANSPIDQIYLSDTIHNNTTEEKFKTISSADIICAAIQNTDLIGK
jgi:ribose-phosphate pyrophosphokinase